jgi:plasmid maintenance system killer protein
MPQLTPSERFDKALAKMDANAALQALEAIRLCIENTRHPGLNFEKVKGTKANYTIRANGGNRICLRKTGKGQYDIVDVGSHDYIYKNYG